MRPLDVLLLALAIVTVVLLLARVPDLSLDAAAAHPRTCPAGTFLAADGFCTHIYHYTHPAPARKP